MPITYCIWLRHWIAVADLGVIVVVVVVVRSYRSRINMKQACIKDYIRGQKQEHTYILPIVYCLFPIAHCICRHSELPTSYPGLWAVTLHICTSHLCLHRFGLREYDFICGAALTKKMKHR